VNTETSNEVQTDLSNFLHIDYKPSPKGVRLLHVTHFKFWGPNSSQEWLKLRVVKFCTQIHVGNIKSYQMDNTSPPNGIRLWSCDPFKLHYWCTWSLFIDCKLFQRKYFAAEIFLL